MFDPGVVPTRRPYTRIWTVSGSTQGDGSVGRGSPSESAAPQRGGQGDHAGFDLARTFEAPRGSGRSRPRSTLPNAGHLRPLLALPHDLVGARVVRELDREHGRHGGTARLGWVSADMRHAADGLIGILMERAVAALQSRRRPDASSPTDPSVPCPLPTHATSPRSTHVASARRRSAPGPDSARAVRPGLSPASEGFSVSPSRRERGYAAAAPLPPGAWCAGKREVGNAMSPGS